MRFTALLHHITVDLLKRSYFALERDSAPGIDGVAWQAYGEDLEEKLTDLHDRIHKGSYRARPARRTYIPKADGSQRPLAILCVEDKVVQQAVAMVLEAIYEEDFIGFSYGFRPGRGQHDALDALHVGILRKRVNWVLDADIRGFYDAMSHTWIIRFLEHCIADKRILRLVAKWLKVGIKCMHDPIAKTGAWVKQMLQGHLNYYAVSGNHPSLWWFCNQVRRLWLKSLRRRSQNARLS